MLGCTGALRQVRWLRQRKRASNAENVGESRLSTSKPTHFIELNAFCQRRSAIASASVSFTPQGCCAGAGEGDGDGAGSPGLAGAGDGEGDGDGEGEGEGDARGPV